MSSSSFPETILSESPAATIAVGSDLAGRLKPGDVVLLSGELGAGKTTLVRGFLRSLGYLGVVRSPTFNLLQTFDTEPPVLHADFYRIMDAQATGLEDYLSTHISLIEWAEAALPLLDIDRCWRVHLEVVGMQRQITIRPPIPNKKG